MPKESPKQQKIVGRVMHEFAHGELKSGPEGEAGKVKNRKQAIAIALHEAGASKYESKKENEESLAKTERKQAEGKTYQQEAEGKSHVGASGRRESTPAMGGETPLHRRGAAARPAVPRRRRSTSARSPQASRVAPGCRNSNWKARCITEASLLPLREKLSAKPTDRCDRQQRDGSVRR
jgi:hypothetical protein